MSVGYKKPPTHSQFAKGKSGNPKGRPKGISNAGSGASVINTMVTVAVDGVPRKMSLNEALLMGLAQRGLAGNTPAAREFLKIAEKIAEKAEQKKIEAEKHPEGIMPPFARFLLRSGDMSACSEPLRRLDAIQIEGKVYRVRTWVVEAALARNERNRLSLNDKDFEAIAKSMLNPEDLPALREKYRWVCSDATLALAPPWANDR